MALHTDWLNWGLRLLGLQPASRLRGLRLPGRLQLREPGLRSSLPSSGLGGPVPALPLGQSPVSPPQAGAWTDGPLHCDSRVWGGDLSEGRCLSDRWCEPDSSRTLPGLWASDTPAPGGLHPRIRVRSRRAPHIPRDEAAALRSGLLRASALRPAQAAQPSSPARPSRPAPPALYSRGPTADPAGSTCVLLVFLEGSTRP